MVHSSRPRRHFIKRKRGDAHLEEREPSLINLPFPVPSIPIISNLLDPLISGEKPHQVSSSSAQAPAPTASSAPSSPDTSNTGSSGDNSASSSASGDNGNSPSDNDTGSESGSSSSSGSESGSGSKDPSPTVSSAASTPTVASGKGGSYVDTSDSKPTSSQGAAASPSVASASAVAVATSSAATEATDTNSTEVESLGSATSTASNAPSSPIANIAAAVDNNGSSSVVQGASSSPSAQPTVIGSLGAGVGSSSSSDSGSGSATDSNSSSVNAASHSSMSGGAIAGIILAALVAGGLLVMFVMRRRAINKRKANQTAWFTGRSNVNTNSNDPARISSRSSWGTPYDGRALYTDAMSPTPDAMGQLNSAPLTAPPGVVTQKQNSRASMYSIGSVSSEGSGEGSGLPLPAAVHGDDMPSTPMSARAFSPTDGYTFPRPPSTTSASTIKEKKRKSVDELIDLNNPFEDRLPPGASPFADPIVPVTPGARASVGSSVGSAGSVIGIGTRVSIARPFTPNLHDEIGVSLGDEVIVLQAFDDGWVQIRNVNNNVGLIPLDCFRAEGQDTATFLASKRVSSFFQAGFLQ